MIEIFKTDVSSTELAACVLDRIHRQFYQYQANFDLDDCDRVLRISGPGTIAVKELIDLLQTMHISAEILPDEVPTTNNPVANAVCAN